MFSHLAVCYYHIDCLLCFSFLFLNIFYYFKAFKVTYTYFDFASIYNYFGGKTEVFGILIFPIEQHDVEAGDAALLTDCILRMDKARPVPSTP